MRPRRTEEGRLVRHPELLAFESQSALSKFMASETPDLPRFDTSRMILLNDPAHGGHGGGPREPPFIVLASDEVVRERPSLREFIVDRQEPWSVWAGGDPEPVYFSFPQIESLQANAGDPFTHHLKVMGNSTASPELSQPELASFDPNDFEEADFETGPPLQVDDAVSSSAVTEPNLSAGPLSASGVGELRAQGDVAAVAHEIQAKLRSVSWTGVEARIDALPGAKDDVYRQIVALDRSIEKCGLTNTETQKAKALTAALIKLVSSPEPAWDAVLGILTSHGMTALLNTVQIAMIFAEIGRILIG